MNRIIYQYTALSSLQTILVAQSGRRISVGVMMKVEVIQEDLNSIKISVRAMHGGVSTAVKDILRLIILTSM